MTVEGSTRKPLLYLFLVLAIGVAIYFFSNPGYGKVSEGTYKMATAIYGACLAESSDRIEKIDQLLNEDDQQDLEISDRERVWLEQIIQQAKDGNWKSAAASAKRIMQDQVEKN